MPAPRTNHTDPASGPTDPMSLASADKEQLQPHLTRLLPGTHLGHGHHGGSRAADTRLQPQRPGAASHAPGWPAVLPEGLGHHLPREPALVPAPSLVAVGSTHTPAIPGAHTAWQIPQTAPRRTPKVTRDRCPSLVSFTKHLCPQPRQVMSWILCYRREG